MPDENKKYKVIIVDDDKFLLNMYALKFDKEGVEVEVAENSEELLNKLKQGLTADLLLLDIIIPGLDGLATLEKLKNENLLKGMKVIMLSNQGDPEGIKKAESLGVDGYIVKATSIPSEVVEKVIAVLKGKK
jgi:DNA-binding response OmpR family regulator